MVSINLSHCASIILFLSQLPYQLSHNSITVIKELSAVIIHCHNTLSQQHAHTVATTCLHCTVGQIIILGEQTLAPSKKKNCRAELKNTYKAHRHTYRHKANMYSDESIQTTAWSMFKPAANKDYWLIDCVVVYVGIQHKWLPSIIPKYVWLQKMFPLVGARLIFWHNSSSLIIFLPFATVFS